MVNKRRHQTGRRAAADLFYHRYSPDHAIDDVFEPGFTRDQISVTMRTRCGWSRWSADHNLMPWLACAAGAIFGMLCGILLRRQHT
jgi:hypothetical protein